MPFSPAERTQMLELKFVGHTVIDRLEQLGYSRLEQLKKAKPAEITLKVSQLIGSTCWHNSPQARSAIAGIIALAQESA
jgi:hypothetical protein